MRKKDLEVNKKKKRTEDKKNLWLGLMWTKIGLVPKDKGPIDIEAHSHKNLKSHQGA